MSSLRRFPAVLWLPVYVGSVFVLMGSHKRNLLIVGLASLLLACCGACLPKGHAARRSP